MKVVIAPDSFKESLSAKQVSAAIYEGLARVWCDATFFCVPVADGGEGTVEALIDATEGKRVTVTVKDPRMRAVTACYGILGDRRTAVIEMAAASGLDHLEANERNPKRTTSYGTGELIRDALDQGIERLIVGLGGSATNDAGIGMLAALGARFLDHNGHSITLDGAGLSQLVEIDIRGLDPRLGNCDILVACDVDTPLCGEYGASAVFGPQKGASAADVALLDTALARFGALTRTLTGRDVASEAGSGAAGGMGAALLGYTNARLKPGVDLVLDAVGLAKLVADADLVFTGEGRIDFQSVRGKAPVGVARLAKRFGVPVVALAGCTGKSYQAVYECGIDAVFAAVPGAMPLQQALRDAALNLADLAENVARIWQLGVRTPAFACGETVRTKKQCPDADRIP